MSAVTKRYAVRVIEPDPAARERSITREETVTTARRLHFHVRSRLAQCFKEPKRGAAVEIVRLYLWDA